MTTQASKIRIIRKLIDKNRLKVDFKKGLVYFISSIGWKVKKFWKDKGGYSLYNFQGKGFKFNIRGQRLIWIAAFGKIDKNGDIDHKNRKRSDNSLMNLRNISQSANRSKRL